MIRVRINNKIAKYDFNHDILHVFFKPYSPSYDDEEFPGIIIKRSEIDESITGLVILDFSKRTPRELKMLLPKYDFPTVEEMQKSSSDQ